LIPNPWTELTTKLKPGDWTNGTVTSVVAFGAFVRLAEGVEGLLHVSELTSGSTQQPRDVVQEGQAVRVRVLEIDAAQQRMKLSLRQPNTRGDGSGAVAPKSPVTFNSPPPPELDPGYWDNLAKSG
jgi:small subunit ribosomal protein S1